MSLPFSEERVEDNIYVRTFSSEVSSHELSWHRDKEDRTVVPLNQNDWLFQRDNQLPHPITEEISVKSGEWHRIIKGKSDLIVKVIKHERSSDPR